MRYSPLDAPVVMSQIEAKYGLPFYVKHASADELVADDCPPSVFAQISPEPDYPCHSKAACYLSHARYLHGRNNYTVDDQRIIERRLAKFAYEWGLQDDIRELAKRHLEVPKDNPSEKYPLRNANEVKAAAEYLVVNTQGKDYVSREYRTLGSRLIAKAASLNVDFDTKTRDKIATICGVRGPFNPDETAAYISKNCYGESALPLKEAVTASTAFQFTSKRADIENAVKAIKMPEKRKSTDKRAVVDGLAFELAGNIYALNSATADLRKKASVYMDINQINGVPGIFKFAETCETLSGVQAHKVAKVFQDAGVQVIGERKRSDRLKLAYVSLV